MFPMAGKPAHDLKRVSTEADCNPPTASAQAGATAGAGAIACSAGAIAGQSTELSPGGRDTRIDTLRGLFLVLMTFDHLPYHPLLRLTMQSLGFVSAAEGFVFVSGLVSAGVYGRILAKQGEANLWARTLSLTTANTHARQKPRLELSI
jgi:OpgC protein